MPGARIGRGHPQGPATQLERRRPGPPVLLAALLGALASAGCGGEDASQAPFEHGTCVDDGVCDLSNETDVWLYEGDPSSSPTAWCETGTIEPLQADGSHVPCPDLGFPVRCSNCSGIDFFYPAGHVCADCPTTGGDGGTSTAGRCSSCLSSCRGLSGCCCGSGCLCESSCTPSCGDG